MRGAGRRRGLGLAVATATVALAWAAAAPAAVPISRGEQLLPISEPECMARAQRAFAAEGWANITAGGRYVSGFKGIHSAYITCNAAANGQTVANVFVASERGDGGVPGAERERLQRQLAGSSAPAGPSGPVPAAPPPPGPLGAEPPGAGKAPAPGPAPVAQPAPSALTPPPATGTPRAVFLGQTGEDFLGPGNQLAPNGVRDLHIRVDGLRAMPSAYTVVGEGNMRWVGPHNGTNWVVLGRPSGSSLDLFFEPYPSTKFRVVLTYPDGRVQDLPVQ